MCPSLNIPANKDLRSEPCQARRHATMKVVGAPSSSYLVSQILARITHADAYQALIMLPVRVDMSAIC